MVQKLFKKAHKSKTNFYTVRSIKLYDYITNTITNIETNEELCPVCVTKTIEDIPTEVYWCEACEIPVHQEIKQAIKEFVLFVASL